MSKKILIVDDSELDRKIIGGALKESGDYIILTAQSGEDALNIIKLEEPDLVVLDTVLPGINGFETCAKIREIPDQPKLKILMVTGLIDAVDAVRAAHAGADDYSVKTSDNLHLMDAIKKLLI